MPTSITDSSAFSSPVQIPSDGDPVTSSSHLLSAQSLANRTRYLKDLVQADSPITVVRYVAPNGGAADAPLNGQGWLVGPGQAISIGAARAKLVIQLDGVCPDGATITQVRVRVDPVAAQASNTDKMSAQVYQTNISGAAYTGTETYTDATSAAQWITISGLSIVVDKTSKAVCVAVKNSLNYALDQCLGAEVTFTTTKRFVD